MRHFLIFGLFLVLGFFGFMFFHLGALKPVEITQSVAGPFYLIAKSHVGPYHKTVQAIEVVEAWAQKEKIECRLSFGQYLDDPKTMEEERLKSRGGCLYLNKPDVAALPKDFENIELPAQDYVVAHFSGSPGIGPMKVYPKVDEYLKQQGLQMAGPVIEVYEILDRERSNAMTTTYYFPVRR